MQEGHWRYCPYIGKGNTVTASQFDLQSLMPFFIANCGLLQLGISNWDNSLALLKYIDDNLPPETVVVDSPLGGSWPEKSFFSEKKYKSVQPLL